jgi:hypothetical protein
LDVRSLELRSATRDDVTAICAMQRASLVETYESFLGRAAVEEFIARGNEERYFEERWQQSMVAIVCGETSASRCRKARCSTSSG